MIRPLRRASALLALVVAGGLALTGCENRMGAAALVGDERVTDARLQSLVDESLAAPGVREALPDSQYMGDMAAYRRAVLNVEVGLLLAEAGAREVGVTVDDGQVADRYRFYQDQSGGAAAFNDELAKRLAISPALFRELVRTEVLRSEIGYETGEVNRPTDAELRRSYEEYAQSASTATLSLIQVPDEAAATEALARVRADPGAFEQVAQQYADQPQTAAEPLQYPQNRLPDDLNATLDMLETGETFSYVLGEGAEPTYLLIRFGGVRRPTLEESRPQLEAQSLQQAAAAGEKYLTSLATDLGVKINPRYGAWDGGKLSIMDFTNPAVESTPTTPAPEPDTGG